MRRTIGCTERYLQSGAAYNVAKGEGSDLHRITKKCTWLPCKLLKSRELQEAPGPGACGGTDQPCMIRTQRYSKNVLHNLRTQSSLEQTGSEMTRCSHR